MLNLLLYFHSALRYVIVLLMIASLITAYRGWLGRNLYTLSIKRIHNVTRVLLIIQMLAGIGLYYFFGFYKLLSHMGELPEQAGFFAIGHIAMMIVSITLINIGYSISTKAGSDLKKFRAIAIFYSIGFLIIFMAIPWPFLHSWAKWI